MSATALSNNDPVEMIHTWGPCFDLAPKDDPQCGNIPNIYLRRGVTVLQVSLDLDRTSLDKTYLFCFGCPSPLSIKSLPISGLPKHYLPNTI